MVFGRDDERLPASGNGRAVVVAGDAHRGLAGAVAELRGLPLVRAAIAPFADGETQVRVADDLSDCDAYLLQPLAPPANERLVSLALLADAVRSAGAARVTALLPYLAYARQDVRQNAGEPRSARVVAEILRAAGVDRAVTVELHSAALESAFPMPIIQLSVDSLVLPVLRQWRDCALTIVAPDAGGLKRAQRYAVALDAELAAITKARPLPDVAAPHQLLGSVTGRRCIIVDDMVSTGNTVVQACQLLRDAGARAVDAFFCHAVLSPGAIERMLAAGVDHLLTTDTLPLSPDVSLHVVSVAPLIASATARLAGARQFASGV